MKKNDKILRFDDNAVLTNEINQIVKIKESRNFETLKPFIFPVFETKSKNADDEESILTDIYDEREKDELKKLLYPTKVSSTWKGLDYSLVLYWGSKFNRLNQWDYLTRDMLPQDMNDYSDVFDTAIYNIEKTAVRIKHFIMSDTIRVYMVESSIDVIPSITSGLLLTDYIWEELYQIIFGNYYIFPFFKECFFVVPLDDGLDMTKIDDYRDIFERVLMMEYPFPEPFTDRVFKYIDSIII